MYQCIAHNSLGTSLSLKVNLVEALNTPFPSIVDPQIERPMLGDSLTLLCNPPESTPKSSQFVYWTMDNNDPFNALQIEQDKRVIMDYTGKVFLLKINEEGFVNLLYA